jgi:hypothetical protein
MSHWQAHREFFCLLCCFNVESWKGGHIRSSFVVTGDHFNLDIDAREQ